MAEEHKLGTSEELCVKLDLVMADASHNKRKNQKDDLSDCDVHNRKDIAGIPRGVWKLKTHAYLFCSALQFTFWYKSTASERKKCRPVPGRILESQMPRVRSTKYRPATGVRDM